jgi:hypothetical protein
MIRTFGICRDSYASQSRDRRSSDYPARIATTTSKSSISPDYFVTLLVVDVVSYMKLARTSKQDLGRTGSIESGGWFQGFQSPHYPPRLTFVREHALNLHGHAHDLAHDHMKAGTMTLCYNPTSRS